MSQDKDLIPVEQPVIDALIGAANSSQSERKIEETFNDNPIRATVEQMRKALEIKPSLWHEPIRSNYGITGWRFRMENGREVHCGPLLHEWVPHERATWPWWYMTCRVPVTLSIWNQRHPVEKNTTEKILPVGTRVKIVMVSRFEDVGITDDLSVETGYSTRILIDDLGDMFDQFSMEP